MLKKRRNGENVSTEGYYLDGGKEFYYSTSTNTASSSNPRGGLWNKLNRLALQAPSGHALLDECLDIAETLIEKNIAYGDSALNPIQIFSRTSNAEQIRVRIDDKLNRLKNGSEYPGDDTVFDLIGYLILYRIASKNANDNEQTEQQGPGLAQPSNKSSILECNESETRCRDCKGREAPCSGC